MRQLFFVYHLTKNFKEKKRKEIDQTSCFSTIINELLYVSNLIMMNKKKLGETNIN